MHTPQAIPTFLKEHNLKLLLFGGKGGVGKTTCASATALHLATQLPDTRFLLASTDPAHSLRDSFGDSPLPPNLEMLEIDPRERLRKFKQAHAGHLRQIALRGTFFDDEDVTRLLDLSMPGLDEIMAFSEISALVERSAYSCIVVDTAPTGHTLRLLGMPEILNKWLHALDAMLAKHRYMVRLYRGHYRKDEIDSFLQDLAASISRLASLLSDPARCRFVPVMLAESLSTSETRRLLGQLENMEIPVSDILVNCLYPVGRECPVCGYTRNCQSNELQKLSTEFSSHSFWEIPLRGAEMRGAEQLGALWDGIQPADPADGRTKNSVKLLPRVDNPASLPGPETSLLIFGGKGGVGKTTLACTTALRLVRQYPGKEVFLFSADPAHSLSDCLNTPVGSFETGVRPGLTAMEIDAQTEFEALKQQYTDEITDFFDSLTERTMLDLAFDREVMERILDLSPPGLDEVMALTRAMDLLQTRRYDIFVFDMAPTGHLIRLLELPELIQEWLKVFFELLLKYREMARLSKTSERLVAVSKQIKSLQSLLRDPRRGQLYTVSVCTEMAFEETRDLLAACGRVGISVPALFLNMATPTGGCSLCNDLAQSQSSVRKRFREAFHDLNQTVVYRCREPRGLDSLTELGQALYSGGRSASPETRDFGNSETV